MSLEEQLEELQVKYNSSKNECNRLFELCNNDLVKLEKLYQKLLPVYSWNVPDTKEEVEQLLTIKLKSKIEDGE